MIKGEPAKVSQYEVKDGETPAPLPFKLSDLQAICSSKFGLGADDVLKIAQTLYEKQLSTYPRTACSYLPESLHADGKSILAKLVGLYPEATGADASIKSRAFNDKQLGGESHFAIIPTGETKTLMSLSPTELSVYKIIVLQYIAQFYPPLKFQQTTGSVVCKGQQFDFSGKVVKDIGWKQLFTKSSEDTDDADEENQTLPALELNELLTHTGDEIKKSTTTKPKLYTEGTLIKAMANIHYELESIVRSYYADETQVRQMVERYKKVLKDTAGLGTEATRSGTINKLKERQYITVVKKNLEITAKGIAVMELLLNDNNRNNFSMLTSPLTTAMYEQQLDDILNHKLTAEKFTQNLHTMISEKVELVKKIGNTITPKQEYTELTRTGNICPQCQGDLVLRNGKYGEFESCSHYPACKYITPKNDKPPAEATDRICSKCQKPMLKRRSSKDITKEFYACSGFPKCKNIEWE